MILDLHSPVIHIFITTRRPVPYEMAFIPSASLVGNRTGGEQGYLRGYLSRNIFFLEGLLQNLAAAAAAAAWKCGDSN